MSRSILVRVSPNGDVQVEAVGFKGRKCETATRPFEAALGKRIRREHKPEYRQVETAAVRQTLGDSPA